MSGKLLGLRKLFVDQDHVLFAIPLVYDQCYVLCPAAGRLYEA